ncbi:Signal peptidase complex subunit 1 [Golovinomyces cichoracearum]|uniref:Signal peptidase complex subunit 1 n=1 Tax=Golovinomyces cichoracearum TaxID=62708 RepID=A0A420IET8_9PEZI|nr:Signal peptidase complex subunit 1 [Golovinomyces cichoracearum]
MADLSEKIRNIAEGHIDFEGQKLVELLATILLISVGIISFVVGFILKDITRTIYISLGGSALVFLLVIPPWPIYKRHDLRWLPVNLNEKKENVSNVSNKSAI